MCKRKLSNTNLKIVFYVLLIEIVLGILYLSLTSTGSDPWNREKSQPKIYTVFKKEESGVSNSTVKFTRRTVPLCPKDPLGLKGIINVTLKVPSLSEINDLHSDLLVGGHYKPQGCKSRSKIAILVPFRDREEHLRIFLFNLIPILKRQEIEFRIFIIEQLRRADNNSSRSRSRSKGQPRLIQEVTDEPVEEVDEDPFNRAMLLNVGFVEGRKLDTFECLFFHDVDNLPENDYNIYECPSEGEANHLATAVQLWNYTLPYRTFFGAVSVINTKDFIRMNGLSNQFWGWGGEDDDLYLRVKNEGLKVRRRSDYVGRYFMLSHKSQIPNKDRMHILMNSEYRFKRDGLSDLKYALEGTEFQRTFTHFKVKLVRVKGLEEGGGDESVLTEGENFEE